MSPTLLERLGATLLDATASALAFSLLVVVAMASCRQPARRCLIARTAIIGLLAIPWLAALGPWTRFNLRGLAAEVLRSPEGAWAPPGFVLESWLGWFGVAYLVALSGGLGLLLLGSLAAARLVRGSSAPDPDLARDYAELSADLRWAPRLGVHDRLAGPVLIGVLRPTILLPPRLARERGDACRLALLHELAHAIRGDSVFGFLSALAGALWWFLPTVRWIRAQLRLDAEFLTDLRAASTFGPAPSYAASLLKLADPRSAGHQDHEPSGGTPMTRSSAGVGSPLGSRVELLVRSPFPLERRPPWAWSVAALLVLLLTMGLSTMFTLRSGAAAPAAPADPAVPVISNGRLHFQRLTFDPPRLDPTGRSVPFVLPGGLPEEFELTVNLLATPVQLNDIRVMGHRIAVAPQEPIQALVLPQIARFHVLKVIRKAGILQIWVNGVSIPVDPSNSEPLDRLTLQVAPGQVGHLQDLLLTW